MRLLRQEERPSRNDGGGVIFEITCSILFQKFGLVESHSEQIPALHLFHNLECPI